jgi:hypothetical protein
MHVDSARRFGLIIAANLAIMACGSSKKAITAKDSGTTSQDLGAEQDLPVDTGSDAADLGHDGAGPDSTGIKPDTTAIKNDAAIDRFIVQVDGGVDGEVNDTAVDNGAMAACKTPVFGGSSPLMDIVVPPVAMGDLNGDGKLDLVTAGGGVLLGKGNGTFLSGVGSATGADPRALVLGDLNGDDMLDLVVANGTTAMVSVLLGRGDGTLVAKVDYACGNGPASVATGDLNGDGKPDLVTANFASNTASVLFGKDDGTFATQGGPQPHGRPECCGAGGRERRRQARHRHLEYHHR